MYVMSVMKVKYKRVHAIETNQERLNKKNPICLTDSNHDFIVDEINHRDGIEYKIDMSVNGNQGSLHGKDLVVV